MARIRPHQPSINSLPLLPTQVVGRAPDCRLRDPDPHVSGHHAEVRWTGRRWELEDLSSRNGTWAGGHRLKPREPVALEPGMVLAFGSPDNHWVVEDVSPPVAMAERPDGELVLGSGGILALPADEAPVVMIHRDAGAGWVMEAEEETGPVKSGTVVSIDGEPWTLHLPQVHASTVTLEAAAATPATVALRLEVQQEGRHVDAWMVLDSGEELAVGPRSNHQLLLALASARAKDQRIDDPRDGWRDQDALKEALDLHGNALNVAIHRLRRFFEAVGLQDAADVVERRSSPREVRLGIADVTILHP